MYTGLTLKGDYFPQINSPCVTSDYLLGVALKKFFSQKQADIKIAYLIRNVTKIDLYKELSQSLGQEQVLGFTCKNTKIKNGQSMNVLYSISLNPLYFLEPSQNLLIEISQQDIYDQNYKTYRKLKELNTSLFRTKRSRFFKTTLCQSLAKIQQKLKNLMIKLKTQQEEDKMNQTNRIRKFQLLDTQLQELKAIYKYLIIGKKIIILNISYLFLNKQLVGKQERQNQ